MNCVYDKFLANQEVGLTGQYQRLGIEVPHTTSIHLNGEKFLIGSTDILEFININITSFFFDEDIQAIVTYLK